MQEFYSLDEVRDFIGSNRMAFIYLYADNCSVCKVLEPKIAEMAAEFPEMASCRANMEKMTELSGLLNVFIVPVALLFIEGKETIRLARNISVYDLSDKINRYYEMLTENIEP